MIEDGFSGKSVGWSHNMATRILTCHWWVTTVTSLC